MRQNGSRKFVAAAAVAATCMCFAGSLTAAPNVDVESTPAVQSLLQKYSGLRVNVESQSHLRQFYGKPMTQAATANEAVTQFFAEHKAALGVDDLAVREMYSNRIGQSANSVFAYQQMMDGLPVENGTVRIVVCNGPRDACVSYAGAKLAARPENGFQPDVLDADAALNVARGAASAQGVTQWTQPELVVFYAANDVARDSAVRAWKIRGDNRDPEHLIGKTYFVDAASGQIVHERDEIYSVDVDGNVSGFATPGTLPDTSTNPEQQYVLQDLRVTIGATNVFTDEFGNFTVPNGGSSAVNVNARLRGRWTDVNNQAGSDQNITLNVTPPGPADFVFNGGTPDQFTTAEMNGYKGTTLTHNFYKAMQPAFNNLDTIMPCNVNINLNCNAYYDGLSINFYTSGGGCVNTCYTTVIAHEYGHHIVNRLGLSQGSFGEGFGDCVALLQYDTPINGQNWCGFGCHVRNPSAAHVQYPCPADPFQSIHFCGQILGGAVWDLRQNLGSSLGEPLGLQVAQQLWSDWSQITNGGSGGEAAHNGTAIEFLTADDTDGDLGNGTPHMFEICDAFLNHSIDCPTVVLGDMEFPNGVPTFAPSNADFMVQVNAVGLAGTPQPGTGKVYHRPLGSLSPFTMESMSELSSNEYEATLPGDDCETEIEFYFSYEDVLGITIFEPDEAPASTFSTLFADSFNTLVAYDFEAADGWVKSGAVNAGEWQRGTPIGGNGAPDSDFDGSGQCWLTGKNADIDVDGGPTFLNSPVIDITGMDDPIIEYATWFSNDTGPNPNNDTMTVEISDNGGASWFNLENIGPSGAEASGGWFLKRFRILDTLPATTTQFKMRFLAFDSLSQDSTVEGGVDAVKIYDIVCLGGGIDGDFDNDGDVDLSDFAQFSLCFGGPNVPPAGSCPPGVDADFDDDGDVDLSDFAEFSLNFTGPL